MYVLFCLSLAQGKPLFIREKLVKAHGQASLACVQMDLTHGCPSRILLAAGPLALLPVAAPLMARVRAQRHGRGATNFGSLTGNIG